MIKIPIFGKKKLLLAFEHGVILSETAKSLGKELTPDIVKRMENIILSEFPAKDPERLSIDMVPHMLAAFETKQ